MNLSAHLYMFPSRQLFRGSLGCAKYAIFPCQLEENAAFVTEFD